MSDEVVGASENVDEEAPCTSRTRPTVAALDEATAGPSTRPDAVRPPATQPQVAHHTPILVNMRQMKNPVLAHIRNCKKEMVTDETGPDYDMGRGACALYLSLKYHVANPDYIMGRLEAVGNRYVVRVLLVVVNKESPEHAVRELTMLCVRCRWTLILAQSVDEAAEYLEMLKLTEFKTAAIFRERETYRKKETSKVPDILWSHHRGEGKAAELDAAIAFLTVHRSINRTDAQHLLANFGTLRAVAEASVEQLALCPGLGMHKAKQIHDMFRAPFQAPGASLGV